jgi:hypothetical protein
MRYNYEPTFTDTSEMDDWWDDENMFAEALVQDEIKVLSNNKLMDVFQECFKSSKNDLDKPIGIISDNGIKWIKLK